MTDLSHLESVVAIDFVVVPTNEFPAPVRHACPAPFAQAATLGFLLVTHAAARSAMRASIHADTLLSTHETRQPIGTEAGNRPRAMSR